MSIIEEARELMRKQTKENGAPSWLLTEMAIKRGGELAKKYGANETIVKTALYLAHTVFSPIWAGDIQKNHEKLSAEFAKNWLQQRGGVSSHDVAVIVNAIAAHHNKIPTTSLEAEVMKNAECIKFISITGSLIWLHELGLRGVPYDEAVEKVLAKMEQKKKLLTLPDCIAEAERSTFVIEKMFTNEQEFLELLK